MPTNPNWPSVSVQVAFNADPNDPAAVPTWVDLTPQLREWSSAYGRQYELDQNEAAEASATFRDLDETLNPDNPASPYTPNVVPYRQILHQAMWPPAPAGTAVNLLNGTWGAHAGHAGFDSGFDSYPLGSGGVPDWITAVGGGSGLQITAASPHDGTQALLFASVAGGGVSWWVPCIPGRQYTTSCWWRQNGTQTFQIEVVGAGVGTVSSVSAAYTRLSRTWTATQPLHQVTVTSTTGATTTRIDSLQHEEGSAVSAYSSTGPVIYNVFRGLVERWPRDWNHQGLYGQCKVVCTDAFAVLANTSLQTEFVEAVRRTDPFYYWPLSEQQDATMFAEMSGNVGPSLQLVEAKYGPGTAPAPGTQMAILGDPGCTGVKFTPDMSGSGSNQQVTVLGTGPLAGVGRPLAVPASTALPFAFSVAAWVQAEDPGSVPFDLQTVLVLYDPFSFPSMLIYTHPTDGTTVEGYTPLINVHPPICDGQPHFLVTVATATATPSTSIKLYIDGVLRGSATSGVLIDREQPLNTIVVGGIRDIADLSTEVLNGSAAHVTVWDRELSAAEVTAMWTAAHTAGAGERTSDRIGRYLADHYTGPVNLDTGATRMGTSTLAKGTELLAACQDIAKTELGDFWVDGAGTVRFASRTSRYLTTAAKWSLGEQESPYEQGIVFDRDPTRVINNVTATRTGGITAIGGDRASVLASQRRYFERAHDAQINPQTDAEAIDYANWIFYAGSDAHTRVASVTLKPSTNPDLWPVALGIGKGDRVTVTRRTAAFTWAADFFVERVEHAHAPGDWTTSLELSPAGLYRTPLILGDGVYGVIGSNVLGF